MSRLRQAITRLSCRPLATRRWRKKVTLHAGERLKMNVRIREDAIQLAEVSVVSAGVSRVKNSAYNAVAVDTRGMLNTTKTLSEALAKAPRT